LLRRWASLRAGGRRQEILKPPAVRPAPPAPASDQICWGIHRRRFIPWTASRFLGSGSLASAAVPRASTSAAPTGRERTAAVQSQPDNSRRWFEEVDRHADPDGV